MRYGLLLFTSILFAASNIQARIGDTYEQSVKRFGKPIVYFKDKHAEAGLFEINNYVIVIKYHKGVSHQEQYGFLAPGKKEKNINRNYMIGTISTIYSSDSFEPLKEKQIDALLKANSKYPWRTAKIVNIKGTKSRVVHYSSKDRIALYHSNGKYLTIENKEEIKDIPISPKEKKLIESLCLPLGSKFIQYEKELGIPYDIYSPVLARFYMDKFLAQPRFKNIKISKALANKEIHRTTVFLLNGMYGGTSTSVDYMILTESGLNIFLPRFKKVQAIIKKDKGREKLTDREDWEHLKLSNTTNIKDKTTTCDTMSPAQIKAFLEGTTGTKWTSCYSSGMASETYFTQREGVGIFGTYYIFTKTLEIKFSTNPYDHDFKEIQRIEEKKKADALKVF